MTEHPDYVQHELIRAIAGEPGLGELEVDVLVEGSVIRLTGRVASERHRGELVRLTKSRFPDYEVSDETEPVEIPPPPAPSGGMS